MMAPGYFEALGRIVAGAGALELLIKWLLMHYGVVPSAAACGAFELSGAIDRLRKHVKTMPDPRRQMFLDPLDKADAVRKDRNEVTHALLMENIDAGQIMRQNFDKRQGVVFAPPSEAALQAVVVEARTAWKMLFDAIVYGSVPAGTPTPPGAF